MIDEINLINNVKTILLDNLNAIQTDKFSNSISIFSLNIRSMVLHFDE